MPACARFLPSEVNAKAMMNVSIGVIGLGYVGLRLAVGFGKVYSTIGYDIDAGRIAPLRDGEDKTWETSPDELAAATKL